MKNRSLRVSALLVILFSLFTSEGMHLVHAASPSTPSIEKTDCASFQDAGLAAPAWQCGYLLVPENRANPQSRTIKVAFAVRKAAGEDPQPDPIVYLTGGPGDGAIDSSWTDWGTPSLKNRDLVLVDPRGVGYSQPKMECPPNASPDAGTQDQPPSVEEENAQTLQWAKSCRDLLVSQGFDLSAYNSQANANDLEDLRHALGYSQWNLYGVSYGTRTALYTMRAFPQGIRSVVLDSVLPPQVDRIGGDLTTTAASFSALFAACKADPACDRDNPDLQIKLDGLIQHLDAKPMKVSVPDPKTGEKKQVWVTSASVTGGLEEIMKRGYLLRLAPLVISRIQAGDRDLVEKLYAGLVSTENPAYYNTVICHDTGALFDADAFQAEVAKHPELKSLYATYSDSFICPVWNAGQTDPSETAPVRSDIPTLLLNGGEFDSATPPSYAQLAASTLSNGHLFIFPQYTHSVGYEECPMSMMTEFIDDPSHAPDLTCMAQMAGLPFITDVVPNKGALNLFLRVQAPTSPFSLAIGFAGLIFLLTIVIVPVAHVRSRRQTDSTQTLPGIASWTLWLTALLDLAFLVGAWILSKRALAINYGWETLVGFSPSASRYFFLLPWITSLLGFVLFVFAVLAWKNRWWKRSGLILFSLGTLAALTLSGILIYMKVISL
jgi:pimeloyl-ACP methyl ester carboxylesterase